jgi:hypothetical protein
MRVIYIACVRVRPVVQRGHGQLVWTKKNRVRDWFRLKRLAEKWSRAVCEMTRVFPEVIESASLAHPEDIRALRTETATIKSNSARLGLVLNLRLFGSLDFQASLVTDRLAAGEQLEAAPRRASFAFR